MHGEGCLAKASFRLVSDNLKKYKLYKLIIVTHKLSHTVHWHDNKDQFLKLGIHKRTHSAIYQTYTVIILGNFRAITILQRLFSYINCHLKFFWDLVFTVHTYLARHRYTFAFSIFAEECNICSQMSNSLASDSAYFMAET